MVFEVFDYQIRPYNSMCWHLFKRNPKHDPSKPRSREWTDLNCYPSTLAHALNIVRERYMREDVATTAVGADSSISALVEVNESFATQLEGLDIRPREADGWSPCSR